MPQEFQQRELTRRAQSEPHRHSPSASGHWLRTAGVLAPLVIGEVVKDADKRWRYIRITSVAMALISEGLYAHRVHQEQVDRERQAER
jgi:hypothetical protein